MGKITQELVQESAPAGKRVGGMVLRAIPSMVGRKQEGR